MGGLKLVQSAELPERDSENQTILRAYGSILQPPQPVGPANVQGGGGQTRVPYEEVTRKEGSWSVER